MYVHKRNDTKPSTNNTKHSIYKRTYFGGESRIVWKPIRYKGQNLQPQTYQGHDDDGEYFRLYLNDLQQGNMPVKNLKCQHKSEAGYCKLAWSHFTSGLKMLSLSLFGKACFIYTRLLTRVAGTGWWIAYRKIRTYTSQIFERNNWSLKWHSYSSWTFI